MASTTLYDEIRLISKGLYRIVSDIVGPECIVKLRRQEIDVGNSFLKCDYYRGTTYVISGSRAEGLNFESSDFDIMYIDRKAIVLTSSTLIAAPYNKTPTILLMENENITPGFTLIRCLRFDQNNETLKNALVIRGNDTYISSKQIRESFMSTNLSTCHGPCQTKTDFGFDSDHAFTIRCPDLPKQANVFVRRSLHNGWPSYDTLTEICKEGCLLVPISSKQQQYSDMEDLQWRISFSLAEKKLVYSMNHTQFLCYGLLKLFLNEMIKNPFEDLLCSYFMKTAVFWEVSENPFDWSPLRILSKFWNCVRRLIQWVSVGYCPNFFIPENNMFFGKIYGEKQIILLSTLRELNKDGYWSLLRCPSLAKDLSSLITQPEIAHTISVDEMKYVPLSMIEEQRLRVILSFYIHINVTKKAAVVKTMIKMLLMNTESTEINCAVRLGVNNVLQGYATNLLLFENSGYYLENRNRIQYNAYKVATSILRRTRTYFCMSYFILIKHFYMSGNYHETIDMIHYTKRKLQSQPFMYIWTLDVDIMMAALQQAMSYDTMIKSFIMSYVRMDLHTTVEGLIPECLALAETTGSSLLRIPPLVYLNFLLILSYTRLGENHRRYDILDELQTLLYNDDSHHIHFSDRALSWEILGICQHLCGYRHGAYVSYLHALDDEYNYFKQATIERLNSLRNY